MAPGTRHTHADGNLRDHGVHLRELVTCPRVERRGRDVGMRLVRGQLGDIVNWRVLSSYIEQRGSLGVACLQTDVIKTWG